MSNWSVGDGELTQVVADHFWSDFDLVEGLTVVHTDHRADHFWEDDHISHVGSDWSWLFVLWGGQLGSSQLLHEASWLVTQTTGESSSDSGWSQLDELLVGQFQHLFQVNTSVGVGFENSSVLSWSSGHDAILWVFLDLWLIQTTVLLYGLENTMYFLMV